MDESSEKPDFRSPSGGVPQSSGRHDVDRDEVVTAWLSDGSPDGSRATPGRWTTRIIILALMVFVLGPVLWNWAPREIARWHVAAAMERHQAGDHAGAMAKLDEALTWDRQSATIYRQRGDWNSEAGLYEAAIQDYSQAVQWEPENPLNYNQRSIALQHAGRHDESVQDWLAINELWSDADAEQQAMALNGLAYARALGKTDLDQALDEVNQALNLLGPNAAMLDTRGFIQFLRGDKDAARHDLQQAVEAVEQQLASLQDQQDYSDDQRWARELKEFQQSVAVIRYHRALVYEALGEDELAEQDLTRVRQLGYEPGEHLF